MYMSRHPSLCLELLQMWWKNIQTIRRFSEWKKKIREKKRWFAEKNNRSRPVTIILLNPAASVLHNDGADTCIPLRIWWKGLQNVFGNYCLLTCERFNIGWGKTFTKKNNITEIIDMRLQLEWYPCSVLSVRSCSNVLAGVQLYPGPCVLCRCYAW